MNFLSNSDLGVNLVELLKSYLTSSRLHGDWCGGVEYDFEDEDLDHGRPQRFTHVVASSNGDIHGNEGPATAGVSHGQRLRLQRDAEEPAAEDDNASSVDVLEIPNGYSNVHPPQKEGNIAEFNVLIFSVRDINELDMEISLEIRLQIFWRDHRLANWSLAIEPGKDYIVLHHKALQKIWLPDIYVGKFAHD